MPVVPDDVVGGVVCRWQDQDQQGRPVVRTLTASQTATLVADLKARSEPFQAMPCPAPPAGRPTLSLALTNAWGDVLAVSWSGCPGSYVYLRDGEQLRWTPSDAATTLLERIAG
ncbi:MAG: hypothetical protein HZY73_13220 [Micropruina sp.]|nr:MAG: hypothetical protein HZY73_13220 [Micropruina sp.]